MMPDGRGAIRRLTGSVALLLCAGALLALPALSAARPPRHPQLVFSTYLGGSYKYGDSANAIAVDRAGYVYVTGHSYSPHVFPVTPGALGESQGGFPTSAFVAKFDPTGSHLVYSALLSGEAGETSGEGIAVDPAGNAYVAGYTSAKDFPTTPGAPHETGSGGFVAKLDPTGSRLVYSTLLGDPGPDATAIAVDPGGNAYVAAGLAIKLDPNGGPVYEKPLDHGGALSVAVDPAGNPYVAGDAGEGFATTPGATRVADQGAFAAKLDPSDGDFLYAALLGDGSSYADAIAVDPAGNAYVTGGTDSRSFPTTPGALQAKIPGRKSLNATAFVVKLDPEGNRTYSTYLAGPSHGHPCGCGAAAGIAADVAGNAFVTGSTASPRFPVTTGALQRNKGTRVTYVGSPFVSELDAAGDRLRYSTYLGGAGNDFASALALGPSGHVYVTGGTLSYNFPTTPGAFQRKSREDDGYAVFASELDPSGSPVAGLAIRSIKRRGNRIRLRGSLDPRAAGRLAGSAAHRKTRKRVRVRRRHGKFVAISTPLVDGKAWRIAIRFKGRRRWQDERLCRRVRVGVKRSHHWVRLRARRCTASG
jgi:hypothetical protein